MMSKRKYILLDKDDITKQCGSMTVYELAKAAKIPVSNVYNWITNIGVLDDKYVVIEDN